MKILCSVLLYFACLASNAQDKIEGIGKFKIGKTTVNDLMKYARGSSLAVQEAQSDVYEGSTGILYKLSYKPDYVLDRVSGCTSTSVYYLRKYDVAGIEINNVYLMFFDNLLISFEADNSPELKTAFVTKYGEPELSSNHQTVRCGTETTYYSKWYNGTVTATALFSKLFSSSCKITYVDILTIADEVLIKNERECRELARAKLNSIKQSADKKALKDL
ncbi:hypothetical protein M0L20_29580 [Spirosoma sp. RP8]|uniref:DUF4468 domain-containing protein n=1 Tax=Spirosoma liriopis TaxID=2937440 RepID=A0ABT0HV27_9BACT|nr:hypothetical protein [Spirosoma liriopis]MCK8496054.1 hypothetical protein [Spirosoma liriopis]